VPSGREKSITTSTAASSELATFTPKGPTPASSPTSRPMASCPAISMAAATSNRCDSMASAARRRPIRPAAPVIAIFVMTVPLPLKGWLSTNYTNSTNWGRGKRVIVAAPRVRGTLVVTRQDASTTMPFRTPANLRLAFRPPRGRKNRPRLPAVPDRPRCPSSGPSRHLTQQRTGVHYPLPATSRA
jgi:hypothetical protein